MVKVSAALCGAKTDDGSSVEAATAWSRSFQEIEMRGKGLCGNRGEGHDVRKTKALTVDILVPLLGLFTHDWVRSAACIAYVRI